jgi:uncharacterized protein YkwD
MSGPRTTKLVRAAAACLAAAVVLAGAPAASAACAGANLRAEQASTAQLESATLCLMNKERRKRGIKALSLQKQLSQASLAHTLDMVKALLFSHTGSNGSDVVDRVKKTGYLRGTSKWLLGENIAYGYGDTSRPAEIMDMLMHSPEHKKNLLDKSFRDVGVSVEYGTPEREFRNEGATYTTDFGARRK